LLSVEENLHESHQKFSDILPEGTLYHRTPLTPMYLHQCSFQLQIGVCCSRLLKAFCGPQLIEALMQVIKVSSGVAETGLHWSLGKVCNLLWKLEFPFTFVMVPAPQLKSEFWSTLLNPRKFLILRELSLFNFYHSR